MGLVIQVKSKKCIVNEIRINDLMFAMGAPKVHRPNRAVKATVSQNFYTDGKLFVDRFDLINSSDLMNKRGIRAKMFVDLAMSLECSLKSLIISLSKDDESPIDAYKKARSYSHNLDKLYKEVKERSKNRFKLPKKNAGLFIDLADLGISSRYSYELWMLRIQAEDRDLFLGNDLLSRTLDDYNWGIEVRNEAGRLNNCAVDCHSRFMSRHSILSGKRLSAFGDAMDDFLNNIS